MAKAFNPNRIYEDYDPPSDLVSEDGCDTILVYLPGYKKEQLKVQLTTSRILKVSGERQIADNKWRRFNKEFRVPATCDTKEITAKFEGGILYIRQPKLITPAAPAEAPEQPADKVKTAAPSPQQAPRLPQPQPQQQTPHLPHPQPQQQTPHLPHPQPQQKTSDLPQLQARDRPQSPPQPQQQAPLQEPQKDSEENKMKRKGSEEDETSKEKRSRISKESEEEKDQCGFTPRPKQMVDRGRGLFTELRKPENLKRLVVSVLLVLSIGFYTTYIFKSFAGDDKEL